MPITELTSTHPTQPLSLAGRHVLVTGASRGIGWATARACASAGATLTLSARDAERLNRRRDELIASRNASCAAVAADLTVPNAAERMVADAVAINGPIDILVNNAGFGASQPFAKMTAEHWDEMIGVNLSGVFHVTRAAIAGMLERKDGRIINVASTAGVTGYAYVAAYCAAKHGVVGLTRALAKEYARSGITVNAVCPGYVDTDMTATTIDTIVRKTGRSAEEARAELAKINPQGRLIRPEEIADAVLWLAGPGAASVTGQCIVIAGGEVMP
ncbi:MAG TPA: SDR family NAD(P)-dependent oxidoreductase [Ferrovibrio sp.]|uniref:SDR family NAD(P)-dependent oxidoreductase n=1 Tax=Ferrovibrio sp. TaxID=1917215 RepID=UPI002B4B35E9|nr:SDR family NAD(P)-dependent oxidoreductase [Ferrovibrio sp.]HLT75811.1 SDR family NAD(P)-dependent oxidoreductase [Ferrovibrio sp.]